MEITLYKNFSKQINSTKRPNSSVSHVTTDVKLKAPTTLTAPTFIIRGVDLSVNYLKWGNRYYFVNEIVLGNNAQYELICTLDVMATWKTNILNSKQYVLRSASSYDTNIEDSAYIAKANKEFTTTELDTGTMRFSNDPDTVLMGIIGKGGDNTTMGAVNYYAMPLSSCREVLNMLMSDNPTYLNIDTTSMEIGLQKALINPIQYIVSCELIPFNFEDRFMPTPESLVNTIDVGWWSMSVTKASKIPLSVLKSRQVIWSKQISLPSHPNHEARGMYLNYNNWSHHTLYVEPYGVIPIDRSALKNNEIKIIEYYDLISGTGTLVVNNEPTTGHNGEIAVYKNAKISIPIQLSQSGVDKIAQAQINNAIAQNDFNQDMSVIGGVLGSASGVMGIATATNAGGVVGGAMGVLNSAFNTYNSVQNSKFNKQSLLLDARRASFPITEKSGANGALMAWNVKPLLLSSFDIPTDDDNTHLGRPLCQDVTLSTLSGYTQTRDASLNLPATIQEVETVKNIMNGGFYIE